MGREAGTSGRYYPVSHFLGELSSGNYKIPAVDYALSCKQNGFLGKPLSFFHRRSRFPGKEESWAPFLFTNSQAHRLPFSTAPTSPISTHNSRLVPVEATREALIRPPPPTAAETNAFFIPRECLVATQLLCSGSWYGLGTRGNLQLWAPQAALVGLQPREKAKAPGSSAQARAKLHPGRAK